MPRTAVDNTVNNVLPGYSSVITAYILSAGGEAQSTQELEAQVEAVAKDEPWLSSSPVTGGRP